MNSQPYLAETVFQGVFSTHCLENLSPWMLEASAELCVYDSESSYSCFWNIYNILSYECLRISRILRIFSLKWRHFCSNRSDTGAKGLVRVPTSLTVFPWSLLKKNWCLSLTQAWNKPDMVVHTCNPSWRQKDQKFKVGFGTIWNAQTFI